MKKTLIPVLLIVAIVACHRKTSPTVTDRTELPPPPPPAPPVALVSAADLEAGKTIYTTKCARCHPAKPVENWTVDGWKPILKSMIPKARLDSTQTVQLTAYVNAGAKKG